MDNSNGAAPQLGRFPQGSKAETWPWRARREVVGRFCGHEEETRQGAIQIDFTKGSVKPQVSLRRRGSSAARYLVLAANQRPAADGFAMPGDKSQSGNEKAKGNCAGEIKSR